MESFVIILNGKMERFAIIVNGWKTLTIITKHSILDVAAVLNPPLSSINFWLIQTNSSRKFQDTCTIVTGFSDFHIFVITVLTLCVPKQKPNIQTFRTFKRFRNNLFRSESDYELWKLDVRNIELGLFYEFLAVQSIAEKSNWKKIAGNDNFFMECRFR